jgi:tRNA-modifying protein YgfZ
MVMNDGHPWLPEYEAAIAGAGLVLLRDWATVRVTGADRASFLHNMCTNDVKRLAPGDGCEAFFTDVKGKTLAHGFLLAEQDAILIVMPPGTAAGLIAHLDRYIIREDVTLSDDSSSRTWQLLFGKQSNALLSGTIGESDVDLASPWSHRRVDQGSDASLLVRCDLPWTGGWLLGSSVDSSTALYQHLRGHGAVDASDETWNAVRVESNWPLWGVDFDATNLPQEVARDALAISFRKGCYLGQETVARIDALGHVNKQLAIVQFEGDLVPSGGTELFQGEHVVGRATSTCWSPRAASPLALAMVKRGANAPGTTLRWSEGAGNVVTFSPGGSLRTP